MRTATKQKYASRIDKIQPRVLRGSDEFEAAYGIAERKLSQMRTDGLPCCLDGKIFIYYCDEVDEWIKKNWRVQTLKLKEQ